MPSPARLFLDVTGVMGPSDLSFLGVDGLKAFGDLTVGIESLLEISEGLSSPTGDWRDENPIDFDFDRGGRASGGLRCTVWLRGEANCAMPVLVGKGKTDVDGLAV